MTAQQTPDRDELREDAEAHLRYGGGGDDLANGVLALLDQLDQAEGIIRRQERYIEGLESVDAVGLRERAGQTEARLQAVRDVHEESGPINRAGWTKCLHCSEKTKVPVLHPCPTIRALDT